MKLNPVPPYKPRHIASTGTGTEDDPFVLQVSTDGGSGVTPVDSLQVSRNASVSNSPITITATAGVVTGWVLVNPNTSIVYVKIYNTATPTVGTTTPIAVLPIPPGDGTTPGIYIKDDNESYRGFDALAIAAVTGLADNSTTAPASPIYAEIVWS